MPLKIFEILSRGKFHSCNKYTLLKNIKNAKDSLPDKMKEHLLCELIKDVSDKSCDKNDSIKLSQNHGKKKKFLLLIIVHKKRKKKNRLAKLEMKMCAKLFQNLH